MNTLGPPTHLIGKILGRCKYLEMKGSTKTLYQQKLFTAVITLCNYDWQEGGIKLYILETFLDRSVLFLVRIVSFLLLQTGLSGNLIVLSVFYYGGLMMQDHVMTVGNLSAFLLYAAYSGFSISGERSHDHSREPLGVPSIRCVFWILHIRLEIHSTYLNTLQGFTCHKFILSLKIYNPLAQIKSIS